MQRIQRYTGQTVQMHVIPGLEPVSKLPVPGRGGAAAGKGRRPFASGGQRRQGGAPKPAGGYQPRTRTQR